jgi:dCMP deaminase
MDKWDERFIELSGCIAKWSKDPSTKFGAVIVRHNKTIVSMGYNGFPRGTDDSSALYANREIKMQRVVHCEMNAIMTAYEPLEGYTLYTWPFLSCPRCAVHVIQAGIKRVVAPKCPADKLDRWKEPLERTKALFKEAGVEVVEL